MGSGDDQGGTARERLRYAFDNLMARGTPALVGLLALGTLGFVLLWVVVVSLFGLLPEELAGQSFAQRVWFALMRAMDAGAVGGDAGSWPFLLANLAITIAGIFVLSALIGVLNAGLEGKLDELRRGRSKVIESGHTLVVGWSPAIYTVVEELVTANANKKDACIVVLAERGKTEMEDMLRERVADTKSTRVVCRSGIATEPSDLEMVSVDTARAILVLSPEGDDDPDIQVIKTMLAILHSPSRRQAPHHVVAELRHEKNHGIARMVGRGEAEIVVASDLISRITVQTCRQSGLSVVHTELLDFGGVEIYFADADRLVGRRFGEILNLYPDSAVLGLRTHDGPVVLPEMDRRIEPGDRVIAIAEDDDRVVLADAAVPFDESSIVCPERPAPKPERTLVLGWNDRARNILRGLDAYVAEGSVTTVVAAADHREAFDAAAAPLVASKASFVAADTTDREVLDGLDAKSYDHILVLGDDDAPAERSDARVLVTLLHLREIGQLCGMDFAIVSEMRDVRNRRLAEATDADDFIVSDKLVSLMMCQVAENKELHGVLRDLFDPDGGEIYLKPASDFVRTETPVSFATVVESARRREEVAIGYRLEAHAKDPSRAYGIVVNPSKADAVSFGPQDKVIVVAAS